MKHRRHGNQQIPKIPDDGIIYVRCSTLKNVIKNCENLCEELKVPFDLDKFIVSGSYDGTVVISLENK